jgi:hypothetical protein
LTTTFRVRRADPLPASDDAKIVDLWFNEAGRPSVLPLMPVVDPAIDDD